MFTLFAIVCLGLKCSSIQMPVPTMDQCMIKGQESIAEYIRQNKPPGNYHIQMWSCSVGQRA